jgi:hypothetical protein
MQVELDLVPAMDLASGADGAYVHVVIMGIHTHVLLPARLCSCSQLLLAMHKLAAGAIHGSGDVAVGEEASTRYCTYLIAVHSFGRATASLKTSSGSE